MHPISSNVLNNMIVEVNSNTRGRVKKKEKKEKTVYTATIQ
jgi:hypothetical protein